MIQIEKHHREKDFFKIDLAPMINIVFLLLIFFLLTSTAIKKKESIDLPEADYSQKQQDVKIVVSVGQGNILSLNGESVSIEGLETKLQPLLQRQGKKEVTIEGDKKLAFKQIAKVFQIVNQAGTRDFILATEPAHE